MSKFTELQSINEKLDELNSNLATLIQRLGPDESCICKRNMQERLVSWHCPKHGYFRPGEHGLYDTSSKGEA